MEGRENMQPEVGELDTGEPSSLADALRASLAAAKGGRLSIAGAHGDEDGEAAERRAGGRAATGEQKRRLHTAPAQAGRARAGPGQTRDPNTPTRGSAGA